MQIRVVEASEEVHTMERSQIVRMVATSDRFWERFNGDISFGTIYAKGNQSTQYSLGASTAYVRERWTAGARLESNLSKSTGTTASTRNSLAFTGLHLMSPKNWFYEGVGGLLQSSEQGISLQTLLGGGVGRYLKNTNRASIYLMGGLGWQNASYGKNIADQGSQNTAVGFAATELKIFKFKKTNLEISGSLIPAITDPGRVHFNTNAAYYLKIINDLSWNVSFYGSWDTRPPANFPKSDYGSSSGLSWSFGSR